MLNASAKRTNRAAFTEAIKDKKVFFYVNGTKRNEMNLQSMSKQPANSFG